MSDSMSRHPNASHSASSTRKSGRAVFDDRGGAVWEWQVDTGIFYRDVTDAQLRSLEAPELQLVDTPAPRQYEGLWIHDAHQAPANRAPVRRTKLAPAKQRPVRFNPFRVLWAHLRGV
jgi:hypothetical protein